MLQRTALFAAMSFFVLVAGCASAPGAAYLHVPPAARTQVASTEVVMPIKQSEIYMIVPSSQAVAMQFGMVGALVGAGVDASIAKAADTALQPVRASLADFSFDSVLQADLKSALAQEAWMHPADYTVVKEVSPQKLDDVITNSKSSAVLLVTADYQLSKDGDELTVTISPCLYPVAAELKAMLPGGALKSGPKTRVDNALYCNTLAYHDVVVGAVGDRDANIALWSANNGAAMRSSLQKASTHLTGMMIAGLESPPAPPADPSKSGLPKKSVELVPGYAVPGYVVRTDEGGSYLAFVGGREMYFTTSAMTYQRSTKHKQTAVEREREQRKSK